jgi:hypothetical protein
VLSKHICTLTPAHAINWGAVRLLHHSCCSDTSASLRREGFLEHMSWVQIHSLDRWRGCRVVPSRFQMSHHPQPWPTSLSLLHLPVQASMRQITGFVPQDDIVHEDLSVRQVQLGKVASASVELGSVGVARVSC